MFQTWPGWADKNFQGGTNFFSTNAENFYPNFLLDSTHAIFATGTKLLDIKSEVYRSGGDLVETNN